MPPVKTGRSGGILLPLLLTLILPSSCSVLEDREDCPCRLRVEVRKRCRLTPEREVRLRLRSEISDTRREESHTLSELQDYSIEMRVPKGTVRADGFVGLSHCRREDDVLTIPYGSDADSLYWASGAVEARGETAILPSTTATVPILSARLSAARPPASALRTGHPLRALSAAFPGKRLTAASLPSSPASPIPTTSSWKSAGRKMTRTVPR